MNLQNHIIIIDGIDKTYQVESIRFESYKYAIKFHNSDTLYYYHKDKVIWISNPISIDYSNSRIFVDGNKEKDISGIKMFVSNGVKFFAVTFGNGFTKHLTDDEIEIHRSCLSGKSSNVFDYIRQCAGINMLGLNEEDTFSEGILSSIYSGIDFIDESTAAAPYLNPDRRLKISSTDSLIFPFGCNSSQQQAVKNALTNQISVIQGPPGTGKTQTILNIIANLIKAKKSVLVVSNNNSATDNVLEKLNRIGLGFLVAPLGKKENKEAFIANQPALNPDLPLWRKSSLELNHISSVIKSSLNQVESIFNLRERLARCNQELAEVRIEMIHYQHEHPESITESEVKAPSSKILKISQLIKNHSLEQQDGSIKWLQRIQRFIERQGIKLRLRFLLNIKDNITVESTGRILSLLDWLFYVNKVWELQTEIENIESRLSQLDADGAMKSLTENSLALLKASIALRYKSGRKTIASVKELFNNGKTVLADYPIVLSTTFSSKMCFNSDTIFDYVIMDEASQVSVDTGLLALTCARNAVIVGDTMQLPNVVTDDDRIKLDEILKSSSISDSYNVANHSFLSSVIATIPHVPETLLREHYRCHPDIINFCNQKFYGGNLLIMTKRTDEEKHLFALTTVAGQHCRGHYNQREIDAVKLELLPMLDNHPQIGIIAPYNSQVRQFHSQIPDIEVATVHKYQGREKDTIIMSVTDDVITEFTDNANLLNVAVSRAKDKFCLVVTENPCERKGNIHDLLSYIEYQQGVVIKSRLCSIFDYLFTRIEQYNRQMKSVSGYQSENLTYELIEKISKTYPQLSHIKALCNYPLRYLIRDISSLSQREVKYARHPSTHIDFLIINRVTKEPLLAIETDGYSFHNEKTKQFERDRMKDHILESFQLPLLRLSTVGHGEEQRIVDSLMKCI